MAIKKSLTLRKWNLSGMERARLELARVLLLGYPDADSLDDLPQELIHSFDMLIKLSQTLDGRNRLLWTGCFSDWWKMRNELRHHWMLDAR